MATIAGIGDAPSGSTTAFPCKITTMCLDFDILLEVMRYVEKQREISRFMRTCRTLYEHGVPILLQYGVTLGVGEVWAFERFLRVDPSRNNHLRSLSLSFRFINIGSFRSTLLRIIKNAKNVTTLTITETGMALDYELMRTCATMSTIDTLSITAYPPEVRQRFLSLVVSPVRKLHVANPPTRHYILTPSCLITVLQPFNESLEEVSVSGVCWLQSNPISQSSFPKVTKMRLRDFIFTKMAGLDQSFPNLRELFVDNSDSRMRTADPQQARDENITRQAISGSWPLLDKVSFDLDWLYVFAPTSYVQDLRIVLACSRGVKLDPRRLLDRYRAVVSATRPLRLSILKFQPKNREALATALRDAPHSVQRLELEVEITSASEYSPGLLDVINIVSGVAVAGHALTHFKIVLRWQDNERLGIDIAYAKNLDTRMLALSLSQSLPSLKFFGLDMFSIPYSSASGWAVERQEDGLRLTELPAREACDLLDL